MNGFLWNQKIILTFLSLTDRTWVSSDSVPRLNSEKLIYILISKSLQIPKFTMLFLLEFDNYFTCIIKVLWYIFYNSWKLINFNFCGGPKFNTFPCRRTILEPKFRHLPYCKTELVFVIDSLQLQSCPRYVHAKNIWLQNKEFTGSVFVIRM